MTSSTAPHLHVAARLEDRWSNHQVRRLRARAYRERIIPYPSYGTTEWVRVCARVVLTATGAPTPGSTEKAGWRNLLAAKIPGATVQIRPDMNPTSVESWTAIADRGGYIDTILPIRMRPGWRFVRIFADGDTTGTLAPVQIVDPTATHAIVSDIDDTVLVTMVSRPHRAAWNFLIRAEHRRRPVLGMPELYRELTAKYPQAPVFYLSNGAWNAAGSLRRFLDRAGLPLGALLLTDFGPTETAIFRSGRQHKTESLRRLAREFPQLRWILIGDDGQHDPQIYQDFASDHPGRVAAIAIRKLSAGQQIQASAVPTPSAQARRAVQDLGRTSIVLAHSAHGEGLAAKLRQAGVL